MHTFGAKEFNFKNSGNKEAPFFLFSKCHASRAHANTGGALQDSAATYLVPATANHFAKSEVARPTQRAAKLTSK